MNTTIKRISIVAAVPLLAVAVVSATYSLQASAIATNINSTIGSTISVFTTSGNVAIDATPTGAGVQTINKDVVTVSTNNSAGYNLKLNETTATSALTSGSNTIPATSGTFAAPIAQAANTWGYRVDNAGSFGAGPTAVVSNQAIGTLKFAAVPATASPDTLKSTSATATNDVTNVWYGVAVNTATPSGTYTNSVTYTATTN